MRDRRQGIRYFACLDVKIGTATIFNGLKEEYKGFQGHNIYLLLFTSLGVDENVESKR